ncbi:MAG TPA: polysaccharide biosynthesis/export family protein [Bacteroidales bacterium]|nr:polysaccharide biosynthesis/export family protein [Bacteroidales bacterium]
MKYEKLFLYVSLTFLISSCVTNKKLTYLQSEGAREEFIAITPATYIIQPYDNLFIRVVTPDPQWSDMFNTLQSSAYGLSVNEISADMLSFTVEDDGTIELPYAGKFLVAGKTMQMVKAELDKALKTYIADAVVTVKMVNNYVSIIGEVQRPGRYPIYKDRLNIFQALAMSGDIGTFGNRQKLQLIRQTPDGNIVKEFSVKDRSIIGSQFFYVMPNDVIYVPPIKGRFFQMNAFPYTVILSTITTFILLWNVLK